MGQRQGKVQRVDMIMRVRAQNEYRKRIRAMTGQSREGATEHVVASLSFCPPGYRIAATGDSWASSQGDPMRIAPRCVLFDGAARGSKSKWRFLGLTFCQDGLHEGVSSLPDCEYLFCNTVILGACPVYHRHSHMLKQMHRRAGTLEQALMNSHTSEHTHTYTLWALDPQVVSDWPEINS